MKKMVCKKYQVYDWFRTLDGAKRIDFLNGMLHLCFPLELRFLGSCIEELARKDYSYLRDAEIKANSAQEIQQIENISDKVMRSKMIVTLALLTSNNYECARLLYGLLNVDVLDLLDKIDLDEKIADEFLLLLTMAANHPAFDFQMKTRMSQMCIDAELKLKQNKIICKESENDMGLCNLTAKKKQSNLNNEINSSNCSSNCEETNNVSLTHKSFIIRHDQNLSKESQSNKFNVQNQNERDSKIQNLEINNNNNNNNNESKILTNLNKEEGKTSFLEEYQVENSNNTDKISDTKNDQIIVESNSFINSYESQSDKNNNTNEPLIESINFEGVQTIKGTDNYKFLIKIQWSNKTSNEIDKTYSELCEFNKQLINLYPVELNGLIEASQLVMKENQKEDFVKELPLVTDYCSKIANLPKVVSESEFLRNFFRSNLTSSSIKIANESNSPNRLMKTIDNGSSNPVSPTSLKNIHETKTLSIRVTDDSSNKILQEEFKKDESKATQLPIEKSEISQQNVCKQNLISDKDENEKQIEVSTQVISNASNLINELSINECVQTTSGEQERPNKKPNSTNYQITKSKNNIAVVSVANVMNSNNGNNSNNNTNKDIVIQSQAELAPHSGGHNFRSNQNTQRTNEKASQNYENKTNNSRSSSANSSTGGNQQHQIHTPHQQIANYQSFHSNIYHSNNNLNMFNPIPLPPPIISSSSSTNNPSNQHQIQPQHLPFSNIITQPLHLSTIQPISNMIVASPPCASPTTSNNTTNPHSLNNSRSSSPWMMMMPPPPPPTSSTSSVAPSVATLLPQSQTGALAHHPIQLNSNYYANPYHATHLHHHHPPPPLPQTLHHHNHHHHHHQHQFNSNQSGIRQPLNKQANSFGGKEAFQMNNKNSNSLNHYQMTNSQEELLLRYAVDNNNLNLNMHHHPSPIFPSSIEDGSSTISNSLEKSQNSSKFKSSENLKKTGNKFKNNQHQQQLNQNETVLSTNTDINDVSHENNSNSGRNSPRSNTKSLSSSYQNHSIMPLMPIQMQPYQNNNHQGNQFSPNSISSISSFNKQNFNSTLRFAPHQQNSADQMSYSASSLLAPLINSSNFASSNANLSNSNTLNETNSLPPVAFSTPMQPQSNQQPHQAASFKQLKQFKNSINNERPKSSSPSPLTSLSINKENPINLKNENKTLISTDDDENDDTLINQSNYRSNSTNSTENIQQQQYSQKGHRKSIPNILSNYNPNKQLNNRQHNSHSISLSSSNHHQSATNVSSTSNQAISQKTIGVGGANSLLFSSSQSSSTVSLISPQQTQQIHSPNSNNSQKKQTSSSNIVNFKESTQSQKNCSISAKECELANANDQSAAPVTKIISPNALSNSNIGSGANDSNLTKLTSNTETNRSQAEPNSVGFENSGKDRNNNNGSSKSPSSFCSSQHQHQTLLNTQQQQQSVLSNGTSNLYYSPVVSPFAFIDSQNFYALATSNELNAPPGSSISMGALPPQQSTSSSSSSSSSSSTSSTSSSTQQQQKHSQIPIPGIHQFNPYQQPSISLIPAHHLNAHQLHQLQAQSCNTQISQQQQMPQSYFNLIPVMQPIQSTGPSNILHTNSSFQLINPNFCNPNPNSSTPTPGSSPNPTQSSSQQQQQQQTSTNNQGNINNHNNSTNQMFTQAQMMPPPHLIAAQQFPNSLEQQVISPYNFHHMMALANVVATSNQQQPQQQQIQMNGPMSHLNPIMMMMMNQPPPLPPNQLMNMNSSSSNRINNNNKQQHQSSIYYQHHQPYRSQTPTLTQQQPSPTINNINSNKSNSAHQQSKKKNSCYNCGSMNHSALECKEATLESISQPNQFRLNFKTNNQTGAISFTQQQQINQQNNELDKFEENPSKSNSSNKLNSIKNNSNNKNLASNLTTTSILNSNS